MGTHRIIIGLVTLCCFCLPHLIEAKQPFGVYQQQVFVDQSGHGNFTTIQKAIDSVPTNNSQWFFINVNAGLYREKIKIPWDKQFIVIIGAGERITRVEWNDHNSIEKSPTFATEANHTVVKSITFVNSYNLPSKGKINNNPRVAAVAGFIGGDKSAFYSVGFAGIQDTLWDSGGRHYFHRCTIQGAVDFIFGSGQSIYQVIKANDDLTPEHYQFFLYQLLRGLKYIHTANVFHRDLKPKNILANADCKLKICDFGLARVAFNDTPTAIFWTDYVATRWYRAPELCGSFFSKYTPAIDIWSIGCIFAEILTGKPLFPGKNVVHQLDLMTDMLGTPSAEAIGRVRNEKARRYLSSMRKKKPIPFSHKFPHADPLALRLLERMLAFEPKDRPTAEEALADVYFKGLAKVEREPSAQPVTKLEFEFERRRITKEDVRELIYRESLEYHPKMLKEYLDGSEPTNFMYPSAVEHFKKQFAYLEEHYKNGTSHNPPERQQHASLPRACVLYSDNNHPMAQQNSVEVTDGLSKCSIRDERPRGADRNAQMPMSRVPINVPQTVQGAAVARPGKVVGSVLRYNNCGAATGVEALEQQQRRMVRNPAAASQYPKRTQPCKSNRADEDCAAAEGPSRLKPNAQYIPQKVAAAQDTAMSRWY